VGAPLLPKRLVAIGGILLHLAADFPISYPNQATPNLACGFALPTAGEDDPAILSHSLERHVLTSILASTSYRLIRGVPLTIMAAKGAIECRGSAHNGSRWPTARLTIESV